MTAVWVIVGGAAISLALVFAYCLGHRVGTEKTSRDWRTLEREIDREWRQLFVELGQDHGHELQRVEGQLARADRTIADLNAQIPMVFLAGQVFQAERKDAGL